MTAQAARTRSSNSTTGYSGRAGSSRCYARATASRCGSRALSRHPARQSRLPRVRSASALPSVRHGGTRPRGGLVEHDGEGTPGDAPAASGVTAPMDGEGRCRYGEHRPSLRMLTSRSRSKVEPTGLIVTTARQQLTTTSRRSCGGAVWHRRLGCPSGNPPRTRPTRGSADLRRAFRPSIPNPSLSVDDRPAAVQVYADILFLHRGLPCRRVW